MAESDKNTSTTRVMFALKLLELSLAIVCVGLIVDPISHKMQTNMYHVALVSVSYAGYIIVGTIVLLGHLKAEQIPKNMWVVFSFTGGALFIAAGSIIIDDWRHLWDASKHMGYSKQYMDMMIASGILGIINAALYFVDCALTVAFG